MSEWLASSRTTKTMWLAPAVSSVADELGEVDAGDGGRPAPSSDADTAQLPQSTRPVVASVRQVGWFCGSGADGVTVATLRAPFPP